MDKGLTRREILAGGAALVAALHAPSLGQVGQRRKPGSPRIKAMRLQTSADLGSMEEFYCGKLGLAKKPTGKGTLTVLGGATEVTFVKVSKDGKGPLTHFAFNIPQNKVRHALEWTMKRIPVIPAWGGLGDPSYPKEIVHFQHWNAHSVFFWDPALNLVEFIARHDLDNGVSGAFSTKDVLHASEIGLAVKDPVAFAKWLNSEMKIAAYPPGTPPQFAMGDEDGLLLCLTDGQLWGEHTKTPVNWKTYETEVTIQGDENKTVRAPGYPFTLRVAP